MNEKLLKSGIITIILIIFLISIASSVSADSNSNETTVQTLSKGGLTINYPSGWGASEATSNYTIMSISKLSSIDSLGIGQVNINFEKKPLEGEFTQFVENIYKQMKYDSAFKLVSSGESVVNGKSAIQYHYVSNDGGAEREHMATWFEKGGQAYVILYSAPVDKFESNLYVYNYILSDIQIT